MTKDDVLLQLDRATADWRFAREHCITIKKWCLTVWVGVLVALATGKVLLPFAGALVLLIVPIIMFWGLESLYAAATVRRERLIRALELRIATADYETSDPRSIFFFLTDDDMSWKEKLNEWLVAIATKESLSALYVLLIIASMLFVMLITYQGVLPK